MICLYGKLPLQLRMLKCTLIYTQDLEDGERKIEGISPERTTSVKNSLCRDAQWINGLLCHITKGLMQYELSVLHTVASSLRTRLPLITMAFVSTGNILSFRGGHSSIFIARKRKTSFKHA